MPWEDPDKLLVSRNPSREEYCQRLLASLIFGNLDEYPKWGVAHNVGIKGGKFLKELHTLCFRRDLDGPIEFAEELKLDSITTEDKESYVDCCVFWPNHIWLIELKAIAKSHRQDQLQTYLKKARHFFPERTTEILYLTPEMHRLNSAGKEDHTFAHLYWSETKMLFEKIWATSINTEEKLLVSALQREIQNMDEPHSRFYSANEVIRNSLLIAKKVQGNSVQRGIEILAGDIEDLVLLRARISEALSRIGGLENVRPWIWHSKSSGGKALTKMGEEIGCELRLSYYEKTSV